MPNLDEQTGQFIISRLRLLTRKTYLLYISFVPQAYSEHNAITRYILSCYIKMRSSIRR